MMRLKKGYLLVRWWPIVLVWIAWAYLAATHRSRAAQTSIYQWQHLVNPFDFYSAGCYRTILLNLGLMTTHPLSYPLEWMVWTFLSNGKYLEQKDTRHIRTLDFPIAQTLQIHCAHYANIQTQSVSRMLQTFNFGLLLPDEYLYRSRSLSLSRSLSRS